MATETYGAPLGEIRKAHATAAGDASSTTPAVIALPPGTQYVLVEGNTFSTAVALQIALVPYLRVLKTTDALATATDYSEAAQDAATGTTVTLNSFDTAANNNYLYLGAHIPFRGAAVVIGNTNSNASVLSVDYWNGAWTAVSGLTDGTISGGTTTFGQSGNITWTLPTDWAAVGLTTAVATTGAAVRDRTAPLYWARFKVSAAFDASVTTTSLMALGRSTNYWELVSGRVREQFVSRGPDAFAGVEHRTDAGTAKIIVNVASITKSGFAS